MTRKGASIWQISRDALEQVRRDKPEVFYRIAGRVAARLSERLRHAAEVIAGEKSAPTACACAMFAAGRNPWTDGSSLLGRPRPHAGRPPALRRPPRCRPR